VEVISIIRMLDICKAYPARNGMAEVLRNVNLHIRPGAYAALTGPSGSGKSTLMNLLGCLDKPTSGSYLLDGEDVSRMETGALCRVRLEKIGFVFQGYQLLQKLTAAENVAFPLMLRGVGEQERLRRASIALRRVGLGGRENHYPNQLSGGQQQRVAVARALCASPRLLLCDEPTGALDEQSRDGILDLLDILHREGHTIVTITHDPVVADRAAERWRVANGQVIPDGPLAQWRANAYNKSSIGREGRADVQTVLGAGFVPDALRQRTGGADG